MKIDMHNHTVFSDSTATPHQLVKAGKEKGIIPIITDHNTIAAKKEAKDASRKLGWPVLMGEEILTTGGEITALMLTEEIKNGLVPSDFLAPQKTRKGLTPEGALDAIREQGALAYMPHPFSLTRFGMGKRPDIMERADVIEVINARASQMTDSKAMDFAKRRGMPMGAGSDSHWLGGFGRAYIETEDMEIETPQDLLKAVGRGRPVLAKRVNKLENLYNRFKRTMARMVKPIDKTAHKHRAAQEMAALVVPAERDGTVQGGAEEPDKRRHIRQGMRLFCLVPQFPEFELRACCRAQGVHASP
jgi:predicted metal-dependent phosphoesterase TrpH